MNAPGLLRVVGFNLLVLACYHRPDDEVGSLKLMQELKAFLEIAKAPFVLFADWNRTPDDPEVITWAEWLHAEIRPPTNVAWTCSQGQQRILDFFFVSKALGSLVEVWAEIHSPWSPHRAVRLSLDLQVEDQWAWQQVTPRPLELALGPSRSWHDYVREAKNEANQLYIGYPMMKEATTWGMTQSYHIFATAVERRLVQGFVSIECC